MAGPGAWVVHDKWKEKTLNGTLDGDSNAYVVRLYTSGTNISTVTLADASTATNEVANGNGYTTGGTSVTPSVSEASGVTKLDITDPSWNATGSGITARYAALINTTATPDEVVAHCLLDSADADVVAAAGNTFTIQIHSNGVVLFV